LHFYAIFRTFPAFFSFLSNNFFLLVKFATKDNAKAKDGFDIVRGDDLFHFVKLVAEGIIKIEVKENLVKEQVFIDITDTGSGIPKKDFDTVFQPGYTTRKRGWGLGLSLTKRIVENYHQGSVFVKDSEIAKGTTFRIVLKSNMTYVPTTTS
jgi:nitrogen-specific signal transduction histidine kinase